MAARYALVPENFLRTQGKATQRITAHPSNEIESDNEHQQEQYEEIVDLFPKSYRNRAKLLVHYIGKSMQLRNGRIVYKDGMIGSHLLDLLKYYIYPSALKTSRPSDATKFGVLLKQLDVPDSLVSRSLVHVPTNQKFQDIAEPNKVRNTKRRERVKWSKLAE